MHGKPLNWEMYYGAQLCHFWSKKNKLAMTYSFAIKNLKKYDSMAVDCHRVACVCGD